MIIRRLYFNGQFGLIGQDEKALSVLTKVNGLDKAKGILNDIQTASKEKTEKLFAYGAPVVVTGILLSVFQQAIGINAVLVLFAAYF